MTDISITLNLRQNACFQRCTLRRGDRGGLLRICLREDFRGLALGAVSAALTAKKPGGSLVYQEGELRDREVRLPITSQLTDQPGDVACEVRLFDGEGNLLTTGRFSLEVSDTLYHDGDEVEPPAAPTRVLMAPAGCREGQYFKVSQVDENGTAVKVEATDSPGGGYYAPQFVPEDTGIQVSFVKSEPWMEDVEGVTIPMPQGVPGPQGEPGPQGQPGQTGPAGPQGEAGPKGDKGDKGDPGPQGDPGPAGPQGEPGPAGADGTMTFADLTQAQKDTLKGDPGPAGPQGEPGPRGETGAEGPQGEAGPAGPQGPQGEQGIPGPEGPQGQTGPAGYTPVRGTDYWTDADQQTMVQAVLAALPAWEGGSY